MYVLTQVELKALRPLGLTHKNSRLGMLAILSATIASMVEITRSDNGSKRRRECVIVGECCVVNVYGEYECVQREKKVYIITTNEIES